LSFWQKHSKSFIAAIHENDRIPEKNDLDKAKENALIQQEAQAKFEEEQEKSRKEQLEKDEVKKKQDQVAAENA
jgi:hypothetical protein